MTSQELPSSATKESRLPSVAQVRQLLGKGTPGTAARPTGKTEENSSGAGVPARIRSLLCCPTLIRTKRDPE